MISDSLAQVVDDIDYYLNNKQYANIYAGTLRERLVRLRNEASVIEGYLDTPPDQLDKGLDEAYQSEKKQAHFIVSMTVSQAPTNPEFMADQITKALGSIDTSQFVHVEDPACVSSIAVRPVNTMREVIDQLLDR